MKPVKVILPDDMATGEALPLMLVLKHAAESVGRQLILTEGPYQLAKKVDGPDRIAYLKTELERYRQETDSGQATKIGITDRRYQRVLDGVEKVLLDHAGELEAELGAGTPEVVLWALDILGIDTDDLGWAPSKERAERMGW